MTEHTNPHTCPWWVRVAADWIDGMIEERKELRKAVDRLDQALRKAWPFCWIYKLADWMRRKPR